MTITLATIPRLIPGDLLILAGLILWRRRRAKHLSLRRRVNQYSHIPG